LVRSAKSSYLIWRIIATSDSGN